MLDHSQMVTLGTHSILDEKQKYTPSIDYIIDLAKLHETSCYNNLLPNECIYFYIVFAWVKQIPISMIEKI